MAHLVYLLSIAGLIFGFGFVVFFHELGHFLAAKSVGIKVEQFAVGFGQAIFSWRKGMGVTMGSSRVPFERKLNEHLRQKGLLSQADAEATPLQLVQAAQELGISETEYRLNWIPLGGYVKMLGQDDLKPGSAAVEDPRAYNRKSIGARMVVVSAGVIMNIILAAIGFMVLFLIGFNAPPPFIGTVLNYSPAQRAGLKVGDQVLYINGSWQHDFTEIMLNDALLPEGKEATFVVARPGAGCLTFHLQPQRMNGDKKGLLGVGIGTSSELHVVKADAVDEADMKKALDPQLNYQSPGGRLMPGDEILKVNDTSITPADFTNHVSYDVLYDAMQKGNGKPVTLTVRRQGKEVSLSIPCEFTSAFTPTFAIAGMAPAVRVDHIQDGSALIGKVLPGDVLIEAALDNEFDKAREGVGFDDIQTLSRRANDEKKLITLKVLRDGKPQIFTGLAATAKVGEAGSGQRGLGVSLTPVADGASIGTIVADSPAAKAGVERGSHITAVDGKPVANWFEIRTALQIPGKHSISAIPAGAAEAKTVALTLNDQEAADISLLTLMPAPGPVALLRPLYEPRKTSNPLTAAEWGVTETRDFLLQFYVTLQRMFQGSVPMANMMGPVGIATAGASFASRGVDWLIWFLAMISANLAVVNFLPIPIVDGGLFTFLIIEKVQGRPLSAKAQSWFQIAGLGLIISIFLLVTYHDILRLVY